MNTEPDETGRPTPPPHEVEIEEMPVREGAPLVEVPTPKPVTREVDSNGRMLSAKEDSRHGDEGIDDPPSDGI